MIRVCLTARPGQFPRLRRRPHAITRSVPANQRDHPHFAGLAPGNYAAALIHDENSNARLDTFAGIPREGFGFSRNPRIGFGPPRFSAAMFAIGGVAETQQVTMRYHVLSGANREAGRCVAVTSSLLEYRLCASPFA